MGAGKTAKTIEYLKDFLKDQIGFVVEVYVPRHKLADEWVEALKGVNASVRHILPRTGGTFDQVTGDFQHPVLCSRANYVRDLEVKGHSIYSNACLSSETGEKCPTFNECAYLNQFRLPDEFSTPNTIRVYTHASLFLGRNEYERFAQPDLVIIDEAFLTAAVGNLPVIQQTEITQHIRTMKHPTLGTSLIECICHQGGRLTYLRDQGLTAASFQQVKLGHLNPVIPFHADDTQSRDVKSAKLFKSLQTLLDLVVRDLKDESLERFRQISFDERKQEVVVCEQRPTRLKHTTPLLYLDATADSMVTIAYLGPMRQHSIDVFQTAVVTQVHDRTGSNSSWAEKVEQEKANLKRDDYDNQNNDVARLIVVLNT